MHSKPQILFLLAVVFSTGFAANNCRTGTVVHRPSNNQPFSFPVNWNETHSAPHLAPDQSCSWVVTVPNGFYAKIIIAGKINDTVGHFEIVDGNGNLYMTTHENKEPYYFPSPKFTLIVNNEAQATFAFKIIWAPNDIFPAKTENPNFPVPAIDEYYAGIYYRAHVVNVTQDIFGAGFSSSTNSIMAFPADPKHAYTLRSALVFAGQNANGTYLTSLYQIYTTKTEYIAPASCFVVNVEARGVQDLMLVQDAEFTSDLKPYKQLIGEKNSTVVKTLDGSPNVPSGVAYCGPQTQLLTAISMDVTATLSIFYDSRNPMGPSKVYNGATIQSDLPLTFGGGFLTQYIISGGKSTMTFQLIDV